jgi:hypothetical protein
MHSNIPLVLLLLVTLQLCPSIPAVASQQRSVLLDNEGRLHFRASDVMILNASFRGLLDQLQALNATLHQEIQNRDQQIADLQNRGCHTASTTEPTTTTPGMKFNATSAVQTAKLVARDGTVHDEFGDAVAATDGVVVVGAWNDDDKGNNSGAVYVFEKNLTGQYEQVNKLVASDGAADDWFGSAVAATHDMVVVGARGADDDRGNNSGAVYVFEKNSTGQYEQVSKLVASDGAAHDRFGSALAATKEMVVVGAWSNHDKGNISDSVYLFEKNSTGQYQHVGTLVASDGAAFDSFGWAVAVAADGTVVVGAWGDDDKGRSSGSAYVFEKNSTGQYEQVSKLVASDGAAGDWFGDGVAAIDGMVVVGAQNDDDQGSDSGSIYVFEKNSTGQYEQVSKLLASDGAADTGFGYPMAVTDGTIVVGAYYNSKASAVYVFEKSSTGQYEQVRKLVASDGAVGVVFGTAVAVADATVVVGAYQDDGASGSVYVFE